MDAEQRLHCPVAVELPNLPNGCRGAENLKTNPGLACCGIIFALVGVGMSILSAKNRFLATAEVSCCGDRSSRWVCMT